MHRCCFNKEVRQYLIFSFHNSLSNCDPILCRTRREPVNSRAQWKEAASLLRRWRCAACCPQLGDAALVPLRPAVFRKMPENDCTLVLCLYLWKAAWCEVLTDLTGKTRRIAFPVTRNESYCVLPVKCLNYNVRWRCLVCISSYLFSAIDTALIPNMYL